MAQFTKHAIVASFLKIVATKPVEKITVRDIVDDCGLNRNTFYYYFADIYDLLEELLASEAESAVARGQESGSTADVFVSLALFIAENSDAFRNISNAIGWEGVGYTFSKVLDPAFLRYAEELAGREVPSASHDREDLALIAGVIKNTYFGLLSDWMKRNMRDDPNILFHRVENLFGGSVAEALRRSVGQ